MQSSQTNQSCQTSRVKVLAAVLGGSAIVALGALGSASGGEAFAVGPGPGTAGGGSGVTTYVSPTVPTMSMNQTTSAGSTVTDEVPATTLATAKATPTYKASPAPSMSP